MDYRYNTVIKYIKLLIVLLFSIYYYSIMLIPQNTDIHSSFFFQVSRKAKSHREVNTTSYYLSCSL